MIMALPVIWWIGWLPWMVFSMGYASHLLADAATKSGIRLLYPRNNRYHLLPKPWRFTTGSMAEEVLMAPLAASVLFFLLQNLTH